MIVRTQDVKFTIDRKPQPRRVKLGFEGDNAVERLRFALPDLGEGQTATLMMSGAYANAVALKADAGKWSVDLTAEVIGKSGEVAAYVRTENGGDVWQSDVIMLETGKVPDAEGDIEQRYPTAVGQMLTAMAEHSVEMEEQVKRAEDAADRAESAGSGGGGTGGADGEDGGYYRPSVSADGDLSWSASKPGMPGVETVNIRGPVGPEGRTGRDGTDGAPGRDGTDAEVTAENIAAALGYTPADAEKVNQLSEEIDHVQTLVGSQKIEGTSVENTCIKLAKKMYGTDKAESFIFFTDPHVCNPPNADAENKMLTNLGILKTYYDATPTSFVVCGGDWLNDINQSNTNDDACYKLGRVASYMRANFDRWYTAIGNHEDNYPYGAAYEGAGRNTVEEGLSMETLRNLLLPYEKELYYSFDGAQTKFYVMNSSDVENDQQMTDYRWEQVAWLAERLKADDAANSALVMHSILLRPIGEGVFAHLAENLLKLCEAYNTGNTITLNGNTYDFSDCTGCVRFMLGGHVHDADCAEIHHGIPVILTYNMCRSADSGNGYNPVFDLCLADYDKGEISMVRVGNYGTDRNVPMASRDFNGDTYSVEMNLTNVDVSNHATIVREGASYTNTLTIPYGYTLSSVIVTMGGIDITATSYGEGNVYIESVTGDIAITAAADAPSYTNLADPTSADWAEHAVWNNEEKYIMGAADWTSDIGESVVTNFIPVNRDDVLRIKGFYRDSNLYSGVPSAFIFFDENKELVTRISIKVDDAGKHNGLPVSVEMDDNGVLAYTIIIRGDTNEQFVYNDVCNRVKYVRVNALRTVLSNEVVITVNEEIG